VVDPFQFHASIETKLSRDANFDNPQTMKSYSRRQFIRTISGAGLLCAVPALSPGSDLADTITVSILHTTDLHGHILPTVDYAGNGDLGGLARCATQIRRWRRQNPNSILIDVGDLYQGTEVSLRNKGELMIDLLNYLKCDAWVVGNHEFDWGVDVFGNVLARSKMPALAANISIDGIAAGEISDAKNPFAKIKPFLFKEIGGIKIAIIGAATPGMPFWFRPEFVSGFDFQFPVEPVRRAIVRAKSAGADAIVLAGHMGLKTRGGGDDFANSVIALTTEFPECVAFIAGHTHQAVPSRLVNGSLLTQADHFGIHIGRLDLVFDRASKRLMHRRADCDLMDSRVRLDHTVLSRAQSQLDESQLALAEPIGETALLMRSRSHSTEPSDVERLIGAAIAESLQDRHVHTDGVFHGVFDENKDLPAGPKTVNDVWNLIPFENYIVTAELLPDEIEAILAESYSVRESRALIGFKVETEEQNRQRKITNIRFLDGRELERGFRYRIAFNSFDSQSAGHRFMKLRAILETPQARCTLHPVQTRDAVIDYFRRHKIIDKITAASVLEAAA
jgi:2',3'-cyclic-nucleotide 2'-phosphodiesterase (5'-nucleotidase family)